MPWLDISTYVLQLIQREIGWTADLLGKKDTAHIMRVCRMLCV